MDSGKPQYIEEKPDERILKDKISSYKIASSSATEIISDFEMTGKTPSKVTFDCEIKKISVGPTVDQGVTTDITDSHKDDFVMVELGADL